MIVSGYSRKKYLVAGNLYLNFFTLEGRSNGGWDGMGGEGRVYGG
jgi:hypothetical protein